MAPTTEASLAAWARALARTSTAASGVLAGTYRPIQMFRAASGKPFSAMVGIWGKAGCRLAAVLARGKRSPDRIRGPNAVKPVEARGTWPPGIALRRAPAPA